MIRLDLVPVLIVSLTLAPCALADSGFTDRFEIVNNCGGDVWVIETPPGTSPSVQAQWDWWKDTYGEQYLLKKDAKIKAAVPNKGAPGGNFRFFVGCDETTPTNCKIGALSGPLAGVNTLFEPTFGCDPALHGEQCAFNASSDPSQYPNCAEDPSSAHCAPIASQDNFDISAVDGYTIPMSVSVKNATGCNRTETDGSMLDLALCPTETPDTILSTDMEVEKLIKQNVSLMNRDAKGHPQACSSPGHWFTSPGVGDPVNTGAVAPNGCNSPSFYVCAGSCTDPVANPGGGADECEVGPLLNGSHAVNQTNYVTELKKLGFNGYTWPYDDEYGLQQCDWGGTITLTLCPNGPLHNLH